MCRNSISPIDMAIRRTVLIGALFCLIGIFIYSNTLSAPFVFDDEPSIVRNFSIRNIANLKAIWDFWPTRFITYASFALNYHFGGLDVGPYHWCNILIHLAASCIVGVILRLLFASPALKDEGISRHKDILSWFAALIFLTHPLQTQAVTYTVQRAASLAAFFYLLSLMLYIMSRESSGRRSLAYLGAASVAAVFAMFAKEMALTLPFACLIVERFFFTKQGERMRVGRLAPLLATAAIIPLVMVLTKSVNFEEMHRVSEGAPHISPYHYILTQFRVILTYLRLLLIPLGQNLDYDYPVARSFFEPPVLAGAAFVLAAIALAAALYPRKRLISFSIAFFFLALIPESGLIPINDVIFEHRLYLPLFGFSMLLAGGAYELIGKRRISVAVAAMLVIAATYAALTYQRNRIWSDDLLLWNDVVAKSPQKARPYCNRGIAYFDRKDHARAVADYSRALELNPYYAEAYNNRAIVYSKEYKTGEALADWARAVEIDPSYTEAYYNRALAYANVGDDRAAIADYGKTIELNPCYADAYYDRAISWARVGEGDLAMADYDTVIRLTPDYAKAYNNRGAIYYAREDYVKAFDDFTAAITFSPQDSEAYNNRGILFARQGKLDEARADFDRAIMLNPNSKDARYNRTLIQNPER